MYFICFFFIQVVDPSTGELISVDAAIQKGIFDPAKGKYFNIKTGELLSIQEAVARNLMVTSSKVGSNLKLLDLTLNCCPSSDDDHHIERIGRKLPEKYTEY